jgi:subtilase family serine protease
MRSKPAFVSLAIILLTSLSLAQDTHQLRIVRPVDYRSVVRLQGTMSPRARAEFDRGPVTGAMPMQRVTMVFSRTVAQQADLDQLLTEQQDRSSPNYHKWLTPEEFGDRFGLATQYVNLVAAWLQSQGFTVDEIARSRTWITFSGIAAQVEAAFHTSIHNYAVDGQMHYAPSAEPSIPEAFSGVVEAISGLHDFRPRLHSRVRHASPRITSSLSGNHFVIPGDFGTIYNLPDYANGVFQAGNDGTGQTIGIVGQATDTTVNGITSIAIPLDDATFRSVSGLAAGSLTVTPVGSPNNFTSGEFDEAALDTQWSGAIAPNAVIIFAYSTNALTTSLQFLVNQNIASVISISYGDCEANFTSGEYSTIEGYLAQANSQGQSVAAAAGDVGATDCDGTAQTPVVTATHGLAVDYPASSQYVTAMGGTEFTGDSTATPVNGVAPAQTYWNSSSDPNDTSASAFAYIPETVWNDTTTVTPPGNVATGGGASKQFAKPSWQTGNGVPQDGARDVPDISFTSSPNHDGYLICSQGSCQTGYRRNSDQTFTVIGGTSAAVPVFAGVAALANQKLGARQGNLNPHMYSLAASAPWAFHDITTGDNKVNCTVGTTDCAASPIGYSAAVGYDLATGWGSIDVSGFLNALAGQPAQPDFVVLPSLRTVTSSLTSPASVGVIANSIQGFTGTVTLACTASSTLPGATCPFNPATVAVPGATALTIVASTDPTILGTQTGTMTIQATSGSLVHSVTLNVTINYPDFQISAGNASETVAAGGTTTDTVSLASQQSFSGSVTFSCTGTTGLSCSLNPNPATANPVASVPATLTVSASASAASGSVTITATSGTLTHTLNVPVTVTNPDFTLTVANPVVSIPSGGIITTNLTVAPAGGFTSDVALTCSVPSSLGSTTCSISPSTVPGGNGTALVTLKGAVLAIDRGAPLPFQHRGIGTYATFVFALGMVFTMEPRRSRRCKGRHNRLLGLLLIGLMLGLVSCGSGSGGGSTTHTPTPLSGTVTVTGTSGSLTHSTSIAVTVN